MTDNLSLISGCLLVFLLCAWAVWALAGQIGQSVRSHMAVDRTLGEVDKSETPGLFRLQLLGLVVALLAAASLGAGATIAMVAVFVRMWAE
jgi:hypothetical protein